ncbi:hypothetical protein [Thermoproteus tenax]|uniref:Uncharacterized protein n=1 Tax=Thermoproteus tenax (strain ATCC 35583 / DSM 2078 / JCM 9277 / NBRC 100435 / Kra 1) TaxID=768679 RepID=G4RKI0_THETK|nr:hypothetical protein [Thermoproteus tenax]CCC82075.1 hypothetical protein predicted by Glimmer/Critica [Thermoproteus tenax Kra 1]
MTPSAFLAYLDETTRTMILTKLRAAGVRPEKIMGDSALFFKTLERVLGKHNFELIMKTVKALDETINKLKNALDDPARFIAAAAEVPDEVISRLGGEGALQANRGLGCPEALARAAALIRALLSYLPDEGRRLGEVESRLWSMMTEQCTVLRSLADQAFSIEEI